MPRSRWTPANDKPYWDFVFGVGPCPIPHAYAQNEGRMVRELFVNELKWTRSQLEAYRYRFVVELSRSHLEPVLVRLKPPAAYVREMDEFNLKMILKAMGEMPYTDALAYFQQTVTPVPEVEEIMESYRIHLSKDDYQLIASLSKSLLEAPISATDFRNGNAELSEAIAKLIKLAYAKEAAYV